jgi:metal-sulfur cluster biosynthetic enzyme
MPTVDELRGLIDAALDSVVDPCSLSAGVPLSISDMGLVRDVSIDPVGKVCVRLRLTSPGCIIGVSQFTREITERVSDIAGVDSVTVEFEHSYDWSEEDISAEGRRRLQLVRRTRRESAEASAHQLNPTS